MCVLINLTKQINRDLHKYEYNKYLRYINNMQWPVSRPFKAEEEEAESYWGSNLQQNDIIGCEDLVQDIIEKSNKLTLDEVPFDRDIRWVNVAIGSRPRARISSNNPFINQVQKITKSNVEELNVLDNHYKYGERYEILNLIYYANFWNI